MALVASGSVMGLSVKVEIPTTGGRYFWEISKTVITRSYIALEKIEVSSVI